MITSALNIASINRTSDTQFRTEMSKGAYSGEVEQPFRPT